jgi:hypothetical protein
MILYQILPELEIARFYEEFSARLEHTIMHVHIQEKLYLYFLFLLKNMIFLLIFRN